MRGVRLTGRGWALLVIGLLASLAAALAGERDLIWVTAVPVFLPILALLHLTFDPPVLSQRRTATPATLPIGEASRVVVEVASPATTQAAALSLEDQAPVALGGGAKFSIARGFGAWRQSIGYSVPAKQRGRFEIGPLTARADGALGLATKLLTAAGDATQVRVTPRLWDLDELVKSPRLGASDSTAQRIGLTGTDDVLVREHRHGDDIRRVHWKLSAKQNDLMVRLEEHPWDPSSSLIVDTRSAAHFGEGPDSSLEWAVSAIASVATTLAAGQHSLVVLAPSGVVCSPGHLPGEAAKHLVLEAMTDLPASGEAWLGAAVSDPQLLGSAASVVAATGRLSARDAAALVAAGAKSKGQVALVPDPLAWGSEPGEHPAACRLLTANGWRVETFVPGESVAEVWRRATS